MNDVMEFEYSAELVPDKLVLFFVRLRSGRRLSACAAFVTRACAGSASSGQDRAIEPRCGSHEKRVA